MNSAVSKRRSLTERQWKYFFQHEPAHLSVLHEKNPDDRRLQELVFSAKFHDRGVHCLQAIQFFLDALVCVAKAASRESNYPDTSRVAVLYHFTNAQWVRQAVNDFDQESVSPRVFQDLSLRARDSRAANVVLLSGLLKSLANEDRHGVNCLLDTFLKQPRIDFDEEMAHVVGETALALHRLGVSPERFLKHVTMPHRGMRWLLNAAVRVGIDDSDRFLDVCRNLVKATPAMIQRAMARKGLTSHLDKLLAPESQPLAAATLVSDACTDEGRIWQFAALYAGASQCSSSLGKSFLNEIENRLSSVLAEFASAPHDEEPLFTWHMVARSLTQPELRRDSEHWQDEILFYTHALNVIQLIAHCSQPNRGRMLQSVTQTFEIQPAPDLGRAHMLLLFANALLDVGAIADSQALLPEIRERLKPPPIGQSATHHNHTSGFRRIQIPEVSPWYVPEAMAGLGALQHRAGDLADATHSFEQAALFIDELKAKGHDSDVKAAYSQVLIAASLARVDKQQGHRELERLVAHPHASLWSSCVMTHYDSMREKGIRSLLDRLPTRVPVGSGPSKTSTVSEDQTSTPLLNVPHPDRVRREAEAIDHEFTTTLRVFCSLLPSSRQDTQSNPKTAAELRLHADVVPPVANRIADASFFVRDESERCGILREVFDALGLSHTDYQ